MGKPHKVKKGEVYKHKHYIAEDRTPLPCKVTRIAQGVAYYRPHYGLHDDGSEWLGSPYYVALEKFWGSFYEPDTSDDIKRYQAAITGTDERARDKLIAGLKLSQQD